MTRLLASHSSQAQWLTIRYTRWLVQLYSFLGMEDARSSSILIFGVSFVFTRQDFSDMNYLGIIGSSRSRRARPYFSTWMPSMSLEKILPLLRQSTHRVHTTWIDKVSPSPLSHLITDLSLAHRDPPRTQIRSAHRVDAFRATFLSIHVVCARPCRSFDF